MRIATFQGLKITSASSGDRFSVVLAEPTSARITSNSPTSPSLTSPAPTKAKRISCPLGLHLDSGEGDGDVELRKSKGAISSPRARDFSHKDRLFEIARAVDQIVDLTAQNLKPDPRSMILRISSRSVGRDGNVKFFTYTFFRPQFRRNARTKWFCARRPPPLRKASDWPFPGFTSTRLTP